MSTHNIYFYGEIRKILSRDTLIWNYGLQVCVTHRCGHVLYDMHPDKTLISLFLHQVCSVFALHSGQPVIQEPYHTLLTHCGLNELPQTIYWKMLILILGISGCVI